LKVWWRGLAAGFLLVAWIILLHHPDTIRREECFMPNVKAVLRQLQSEKATLEKQISRIDLALSALGSLNGRGRGRGGKRHLSAAARAGIVAGQKKRWAKWRAAQK
jgi:hypothetical protein